MIHVSRRPKKAYWLLALLAASFIGRLGWALSRPVDAVNLAALPDQLEYLALGRNLLHFGKLCFYDARFAQTVWAYRMPGYPLFIAACGGSIRAIRAVQAIVDASTVLAVYLLARRVLPPSLKSGPIWAAAIVACNPFLIFFTGLILSETLFTAMIVWGMALLAMRKIFVPLVLLVLTVLVRPEGALLPSLLIMTAMVMSTRWKRAHETWAKQAVVALVGILILGVIALSLLPWAYRNTRVLGRPVWLTTNAGITLYDGNHLGADGSSNQNFLVDMPQLKSLSETERDAYLTAAAKDFIAHHPGQFLWLAAKRLARTWSPMPLSDTFGSRSHQAVALAYCLPLDLLMLLGLISSRLSRSAKVFLLIPAIYLTAAHVLTVGSLRYRIPAEPPMAIVAAAVLSRKSQPDPDLPPAAPIA